MSQPELEAAEALLEENGTDFDTQKHTAHVVEFEGSTVHIDTNVWRHSTKLKFQVVVGFGVFILFGLSELTVGALIPELQTHYGVNDASVSYVYVMCTAGYISLAILISKTHGLLGIRGALMLECAIMALCCLVVSTAPPFWLVVAVYFLNGFGYGGLDASLNSFMGNLADSNPILGILHGCYGIGCMTSPPVISYLLYKEHNPWPWNRYYVLLATICAAFVVLFSVTFRHETPAKYKYTTTMPRDVELDDLSDADSSTADLKLNRNATFVDAIKSKVVWVFATMMFIYLGGEASFGSWLITFLIRIKNYSHRHASLMASSYWLGLTLGRMGLGFATAYFFRSELTANLTYITWGTTGYLLFWLLSLTDQKALLYILTFITGVGVGPIFPASVVAAMKVLPSNYHTAGVGFICAFGGAGAAAVNYLIGAIAQSSDFGLRIFPLVVMALYVTLLCMWVVTSRHFRLSF